MRSRWVDHPMIAMNRALRFGQSSVRAVFETIFPFKYRELCIKKTRDKYSPNSGAPLPPISSYIHLICYH